MSTADSDVLNSKRQGAGPPVVLIHGLFGSLENLGGIARILAESATVYSLDLPNHGRSPHHQHMSLSSMAEDVACWMADQGLDSAGFVGHSLGGKVAMELALQRPELVDSLVVMDIAPVHYPPHHSDVFAGLQAVNLQEISSRRDAENIMTPYVPEVAVRSFLLKNIMRTGEGHFAWRMNLPVIRDNYEKLVSANGQSAEYGGNVLFLKGGDSDYIGEEHRHDILSRFPQAKVKVVANTGHWLHAEKPALVAKLIQQFFSV